MSIQVELKDGKGTKNQAKVTSRGQLVVAPLGFSESYSADVDVVNTAYNLVPPVSGKRFVITSFLISTNYLVGVNGATIYLYEAEAEADITIDKVIFELSMPKQTTVPFTPLNLIINEGRWLNVKTDDDDVAVTITGYYIDA